MPIVYICIGVALLLLFMVVFKLNAFISLIIVGLLVGIMEGMSPTEAMTSVTNGLGGTLGSLALVIGFGGMLGKLMADSGGAQRIATTLIHAFGKKRVQLAAVLTAFIVGIALFFETGVVVLIPLVFTIAAEAGVPILYIGMPVIAALITMHGFVPPHPGPTAVAEIFHANLGKTLLYGVIIAIPAVIIGGPLYTKLFKKESLEVDIPKQLFNPKHFEEDEMPGFGISIFTALVPVILIAFQAVVEIAMPHSAILPAAKFLGNPGVALLISVIIAIFTFGLNRGKKMSEVMQSITDSVSGIAMILLIIGAGGAFKQVLVDSHVDKYIADLMEGSTISPLILTWLIAAILRVVLGSATVAGLTAAGIAAPLVGATHVSPELMVLATGAGSMTFSHVNDAGFWIYKEYFNLSIGKTIKTWSVMVTIISLIGLAGVLIINLFL
ncbi:MULTISPECIES: gluconate:H+ symporter [Heyndrickxia]|jgi:Gnt-I system high-affinity gluconate transporter|uniref:Gluconate permease n=1 Tax=Heyndrickxia oleronia TaxID=38875 RepID=A0A8E2LFV7_9BACI|nr:gluconate:H+ symporter [Heyndrickxia oleronia]NYV65078.1 gluconate permease [Bacillus sp. Gen3]OJH20323.1 gluconate permease [Bacillus obstructivus]MCI1589222.1 gluconate:H+ symporter [Heyndrickxia oleronia]MCI1611753.1 gluconate:H+ symporter [Heyndrickxia oleronia]MCI1743240.1 gluconate:H+ symporter [Heyndrickxia oleronia]